MEEPGERHYWLWVTRPEYYASVELNGGWSCHKNTKKGDLSLLWRAKGKSDISHLLQVETDAKPDPAWGHACNYKRLYEFENPVTIKDIRNNDDFFHDWTAYSGNFQGTAFNIPKKHWDKLDQLGSQKNPDYPGYQQLIETSEAPRAKKSDLPNESANFEDSRIGLTEGFGPKSNGEYNESKSPTNYWLFQIMYDLCPESWKLMVNAGIAAQQYPEGWTNETKNINKLRAIKSGDKIIASFKDHKFAGYGEITSDFYRGGSSLEAKTIDGRVFEFGERFNCDWNIIPINGRRKLWLFANFYG